MNRLSEDAKRKIVEKVLRKDGRTIKEIAASHGVGNSTLERWIKQYRNDAIMNETGNCDANADLSLSERFQHLIATASLDDMATSAYCREHGLYSFQLKQWEESFMTQKSSEKKQAWQLERKSLHAENKQLKQELRRKDSALAETAALLVLKKKAALIWGEVEDD